MRELKPSRKAIQQVHLLATRAFLQDHWMRVSVEDNDDFGDFGNFQCHHREGWEGTNQFNCLCREGIMEIAREDGSYKNLKCELIGDPDWNSWYNQIFIPLKEEFWDKWEQEAGLEIAWQDKKDRRRPDKKAMASIGESKEVLIKSIRKSCFKGIRYAEGCAFGEWIDRKFLKPYIHKNKITEVREIWIDDFGTVWIWLNNLGLDELVIQTHTSNLA